MKPYVYIIQNKEQTHWYVGYKQKPKAGEDYWGSSKYLKALIKKTGKENWTKTIISEFDDADIAHEFEQMLLEFMWHLPGRVNKARNGFIDQTDPQVKAAHLAGITKALANPEVKANHKAGIAKRSENPEWIAKNKESKQKLAQDPEWIANHKASRQKLAQDPVWRANQKAGAQKRAKPFIATNIATGEEFFCESGYCDQVKALKLDRSTVSSCLRGNHKQHKGYTFRYA